MPTKPAIVLAAVALGLGACSSTTGTSSTAQPPSGSPLQDSAGPITVSEVTCNDLLHVAPDARAAAALFFLGWYAARTNLNTIDPRNMEPALKAVGDYCEKNPTVTALRAYQVALAPFRARR